MRMKVGVVGSAGGELSEETLAKAREMGRCLARHDVIVVTGSAPGLPHEAVLGAKEIGALVLGISPAHSLDEHRDVYRAPWKEYDALIFTGSGLMAREIEIIRTCEAIVVIGGRSGTLGEFAIAYDEARLIGVLTGTGGVADHISELLEVINKETGAAIVEDDDPEALFQKMMERHEERVKSGLAYRGPVIHEGSG
ncbi:MAG: hypothetical protein ACOX9R_10955 [Armatimonadota bacterium]|jgi:uncharacterized protein (TIGR00725 family)